LLHAINTFSLSRNLSKLSVCTHTHTPHHTTHTPRTHTNMDLDFSHPCDSRIKHSNTHPRKRNAHFYHPPTNTTRLSLKGLLVVRTTQVCTLTHTHTHTHTIITFTPTHSKHKWPCDKNCKFSISPHTSPT
jgi:hypothetical protein